MTNPWAGLDAATAENDLFLDPSVKQEINQAFTPYEESLQTLIDDALDDTAGFFGTGSNPLAMILEEAFNARGTALKSYLTEQLSQSKAFVKTANDAADAMEAAEGD